MCASTSGGMPSRPMVWSSTAWAGAVRSSALARRRAGRSAAGARPSAGAPVTPRSTGVANCGAPAAAQNVLMSVDGRLRLGVDQVERLAVEAGGVGEVVHRLGDVVDGHDVGVAEVDADQRQPRRQAVAQPLHEREEVVGAVDLVHRAGLGVADHDRRPVDPPRDRRHSSRTICSDSNFVRWYGEGRRLALVEHRLVERRRGSHRRRPPRRPGGSSRRRAPRRARARGGCRRRSAARWSRRRRSCRRARRGGRSGRSSPAVLVDPRRRRPRGAAAPRSPMTGTTRSVPQRSEQSLDARPATPRGPGRRSSPSRWSSSSWTRCRPMKPVAPVTKYAMPATLLRGNRADRGGLDSSHARCTERRAGSELTKRSGARRPPPNMISSQLGTEARPLSS